MIRPILFVLLNSLSIAWSINGWAAGCPQSDVPVHTPASLSVDRLSRAFQKPPIAARPWVFWWFQGGYGEAAGMARDLAAMKEKGIGGVLHMQTVNVTGLPLPEEPKMLSPAWDRWFGEALRLANASSLSMAASILDGWGMGGPWIGPTDGAKMLVHAEAQVDGPGRVTDALPRPRTRLGVYRDVAVVAFRERDDRPLLPAEVIASSVNRGYCDEENWPPEHAADSDPDTFWRAGHLPSPERPAEIELRFAKPIAAVGVWIAAMPEAGPRECELLADTGGSVPRLLARFTRRPGERSRVSFPLIQSTRFRLRVTSAHAPDIRLAEFQLLRKGDRPFERRGTKWWDFKSGNRGYWRWPARPYDALEEDYPDDGARDSRAAGVIDLSRRLLLGGRLDWSAPAGRWTILRFGWTAVGEPARMAMGGGYEVDVLSRRGADRMIDHAAVRMNDLSRRRASGMPIVFHTDSWEIGAGVKGQQPTWTDDFREQFRRRRGYDLLPYLPALARRIVDDRETTGRFLYDYRATIADLLAGYYGRLQIRAHRLGGRVNPESGYGTYPFPHMDGLRVFGRADYPMGEVWHDNDVMTVSDPFCDVIRTAASGARIYGRRIVQAETLTYHPWAGQQTPPEEYRRTLNRAFADGLNQAVIHKYVHQPFEWKPGFEDYGIFSRHSTWWPMADGFIGSISRAQFLLQQGLFVADACYFVGEGASRFVPGKEYLRPALPFGYDYDGINAEALLTRATARNGRIRLPDGMSYRYLVLAQPQCATLSPKVLAKIRSLVNAGATLVGDPPSRSPGLTDRIKSDAAVSDHVKALWGHPQIAKGERVVGRGRVFRGLPLAEIFRRDRLSPDCDSDDSRQNGSGRRKDKVTGEIAPVVPNPIDYTHRRTKEGVEIYFLANGTDRKSFRRHRFRVTGMVPERWDPVTDEIRLLPDYESRNGLTVVPLRMEPWEGSFIVFRNKSKRRSLTGRNDFNLRRIATVTGPWEVSFDPEWLYPVLPGIANSGRLQFNRLDDWTRRPEEAVRHYSGIATYRKRIFVTRPGRGWRLDLGVVRDVARVRLNGIDLGAVWCAPRSVPISGALRPGENRLEIDVANLWPNRLIGDAALPVAERRTRTNVSYSPGAPLRSSGLLGPVTIQAETASADPDTPGLTSTR